MSEKKRRAPVPPNYAAHGFHPGLSTHMESPLRSGSAVGGNLVTIKEIENPAYVEADGSQHLKRPPLPLPDYESLYPQKRHGVLGHTRWDHIIAEVNQRQRDCPPEFLGQEMSVDGPEEQAPTLRSSLTQERPAIHNHQTQPQEPKPISSKKVPAPAPPKPVAATHPRSEKDYNQRQNQNPTQTYSSVERPNTSAVLRAVNTDTSNREAQSVMPKDQGKKALQPPPVATDHKYMLPREEPRTTSQTSWDTTPLSDQKEVLVTMSKETPTAKPRQKVGSKEPMKQEDPDSTLVVSASELNSNNQTLPSLAANNVDKKIKEVNEKIAEFDPFPSAALLPKDPWAQLEQNKGVEDYLFTGKVQQEQKLEDQGMTADDLDKLFTSDNPTDPFSSFHGSDSDRHPERKKKNADSNHQPSPVFQRKNSQRKKQLLLSLGHSDNKDTKPRQEPKAKEETTITTAKHSLSPKEATTEFITSASVKQQPQVDEKTQKTVYGGEKVDTQFTEDPFGTGPFSVSSSSPVSPVLTTTEPLQVVMEESASQAGGLSGGKTPLRAWVLPSDVQPVSAQNSNGGGLASMSRRPHPVKPMSSAESQHATSSPAVREIKAHDSTTGKTKQADSVESGPYTQLTQEELITLVVKQQVELSKKDAKIIELEEYIDNLLVRVIEEKPSILLALNAGKQT